MFGIIALAFIVVPIVELFVIIEVASFLGTPETIGLLIVLSFVGAFLVRREGLGVWRRTQQTVARGQLPGRELMDGALILIGGALMLTPGFITDVIGLLLLFPPTRIAARSLMTRRYRNRVAVVQEVRLIREDGPFQEPQ